MYLVFSFSHCKNYVLVYHFLYVGIISFWGKKCLIYYIDILPTFFNHISGEDS